jgi:hypothetical protein
VHHQKTINMTAAVRHTFVQDPVSLFVGSAATPHNWATISGGKGNDKLVAYGKHKQRWQQWIR